MFLLLLFYITILVYLLLKYGCNNITFILLLIILIIIFKSKNIENFSVDDMRFIPCSDNSSDLLIKNNYKLQKIPSMYKDNSFFSKLYKKPINDMFKFPDCDKDYKFQKTYDAFFDRKIYSIDQVEQKSNDLHNLKKDLLLYNNPNNKYRSPNNIETKIIPEFSETDLQKYNEYLDFKKISRVMDYTTCGNSDNKGNRYNCKFPYIFNHKNTYKICNNNENCKNTCCVTL